MGTKVPTAEAVARKWGDVTPGRSAYYEAGVATAGADWEKNTAGAAAAYKAAISAGNIQAMFAGGVKRAGGAKYQRKASGVGKDRFGAGVTAAIGDMQSGVAPMLSAIAAVEPPVRQPRGSAANQQRSVVYQVALNKARLALRSAGA
jgi:hypothetical protein